jgi:hypothetical protein
MEVFDPFRQPQRRHDRVRARPHALRGDRRRRRRERSLRQRPIDADALRQGVAHRRPRRHEGEAVCRSHRQSVRRAAGDTRRDLVLRHAQSVAHHVRPRDRRLVVRRRGPGPSRGSRSPREGWQTTEWNAMEANEVFRLRKPKGPVPRASHRTDRAVSAHRGPVDHGWLRLPRQAHCGAARLLRLRRFS